MTPEQFSQLSHKLDGMFFAELTILVLLLFILLNLCYPRK